LSPTSTSSTARSIIAPDKSTTKWKGSDFVIEVVKNNAKGKPTKDGKSTKEDKSSRGTKVASGTCTVASVLAKAQAAAEARSQAAAETKALAETRKQAAAEAKALVETKALAEATAAATLENQRLGLQQVWNTLNLNLTQTQTYYRRLLKPPPLLRKSCHIWRQPLLQN
jgi:flagellar biosynthesis/type III secretory pathway protein FliH